MTNFRFPNRKTLQTTILDVMKMAESYSKRVENTVGKGKNCSLRAISPVFLKDLYFRHVKTRACLGKG